MLKNKNLKLDFLVKSSLILLVLPLGSVLLFSLSLSYFGSELWEYDGYFAFYVLNLVGSYLIYSLGILVSLILIAIFNKKYMSGAKLKFLQKLGLIIVALVLNWLALLILGKVFL